MALEDPCAEVGRLNVRVQDCRTLLHGRITIEL